MRYLRSSQQAFTLVELLVVVAIIAILAALSSAAFLGTNSARLASAASMLADELDLARQTAISRNADVEFRFYQLPDANTPQSSTPKDYRAFQAFRIDDNNQFIPLRKLATLPVGVVLSTAQNVSSLLTANNPPTFVTGASTGLSLGAFPPAAYNYFSFRFRPDGSANLSPTLAQSWHATLVNQNAPIKNGVLPANFCTIQIDPQSGRTRTFQPR